MSGHFSHRFFLGKVNAGKIFVGKNSHTRYNSVKDVHLLCRLRRANFNRGRAYIPPRATRVKRASPFRKTSLGIFCLKTKFEQCVIIISYICLVISGTKKQDDVFIFAVYNSVKDVPLLYRWRRANFNRG